MTFSAQSAVTEQKLLRQRLDAAFAEAAQPLSRDEVTDIVRNILGSMDGDISATDLRLYASKSGFDEALRVIGEEWISESVERVQALMRVLFALALLLVGAVVMFMAAGLLAMQTQLMQIVQRASH